MIPITRPNLCFRTFKMLNGNSLLINGCSSSSHWHLNSTRTVASSILIHSRCASAHCVTLKLQKKRLLQVRSTSAISAQLGRGLATEPSSGYEYILASKPVHLAQTIFEQCHDLTGLPWWGTIMATTFGLRFAMTLPLAVYSKHITAKVEKLQPEVLTLAKQTFARRYRHRAVAEKWSPEKVKKMVMYLTKPHAKQLYIRDNCHPAKSFVILMVQLPLWICLSLALRNMSGFQLGGKLFVDPDFMIADFAAGGMLWFSNLSIPDQYYIFPVIFGMLNLLNIEMQALQKGPMVRGQRQMLMFMRVLSIVMIPIATFVPVAMSMYWATSASYSTCQNILLKLPSVRALLGMPTTKMDSETPFRDMQETFAQKYLRKGKAEGDDNKNNDDMRMEQSKIDNSTKAPKKI